MDNQILVNDFYKQLPEQRLSYDLFEYIEDIYFFVKDAKGRFIGEIRFIGVYRKA